MSHQKFARDVGLIGITQILTSLSGFLLLPIITKSLGAYYYGMWAQINVTISLLTPLALMGLSMGFVRFLSSVKDENEIKEGTYSILSFVFISGLVISLILFIGANLLATVAFQDTNATYFIRLASFIILFNAIDTIVLFYFRVFRQINIFSYFSIFQSIGKLLFAAILLWAGYGLLGVIVAFLAVQGLVFIGAMYKIIKEIGIIIPKFIYIREYLNFSLPLTPNSLIRWVTDSSDRYLVTFFLGLGSVGVYSAAYSIGWLIQLLIAPIQFILYPELSKLYDEGKNDQVNLYLSYSLRYFLMLAIPAVFGLAALAKPLLRILTSESFVSGWSIIPLIAFAGLLAGVFQILINITHLVKQTKFNFYILLIASLTNIILNLYLIPIYGITGAATATVISYLSMVSICSVISRKYMSVEINLLSITKILIASIFMHYVVSLINPHDTIFLLISVIVGIIIYILSLYALKVFTNKEKLYFKHIFLRLFNIKNSL
jgi:O-antigen/teichoic acid export membrane protein